MLGGTVGGVAHTLMPDYTGSVGAYALVGMGAAFAGIIRVPLTSVIMIFEITRDYSIIVPLMIANLIAYFISSRLQDEPIYEALLHQDGIHLPSGAHAREVLLMVGNAYRPDAQVLSAAETARQAAASVDRERGAWPVVDKHGLRGMVTLQQLDSVPPETPLAELVPDPGPTEHLNEGSFRHVHPDHPLEVAMRRLAESGVPVLPVVSRTNIRELKGTVSLADILKAYAIGQPQVAGAAEPASSTHSRRLLAGIVAVIMGLAVVTAVLNYSYRSQRTARGERYYQSGNELMGGDRIDEAIAQYRNALSVSRSNRNRLALGLALVKAGQFDDAAIYLNEVLHGDPASGPANLGIARVDAEQGRVDDAILHYQRAASGSWAIDAERNRFAARLELAGMLRKAGRLQQAQAELISAAAAASNLPAMREDLGRMLIEYGLPRNAADLFRQLIQHHRDAGGYDGLGEAELALGDYNAAREAFRASLEIDPADATAARSADLCDRILAIDPALRDLPAAERYRRSQELLIQALAARMACSPADDEAVKAAAAAIARKRPPPSWSEAVEADQELARNLWAARLKMCAPPSPDDPLAHLLKP
jgi:tetratricopeptide (TPR) repeat protein/CBS domain-containing protein